MSTVLQKKSKGVSLFMREDEAYLDVAIRYLSSCDQHIAGGVGLQEVIGFNGYHAFESIGGAFNAHLGYSVPRSHVRKLNAFVSAARNSHLVDARAVAALAMILSSTRNLYLYPEKTPLGYKPPKDQISISDAKRLVSRVKGIVRKIRPLI